MEVSGHERQIYCDVGCRSRLLDSLTSGMWRQREQRPVTDADRGSVRHDRLRDWTSMLQCLGFHVHQPRSGLRAVAQSRRARPYVPAVANESAARNLPFHDARID
jgi:hypothetical protein